MARTRPLVIQVVTGDPRPIGRQIVDGVRMAIATGELAAGDQVLCSGRFIGPARLSVLLWPATELDASVLEFHRNMGLLEGAAEATALMHTLRCLKCQSQSIADSDAPMAGDMRHQVRSRILAGESPDQIRGWLIDRYGDYVSYEPEVSATTWPLFAAPVLLLLIGGGVLLRRWGTRRSDAGGDTA